MCSAHYIRETKDKVAERKKGGVYSYRLASLLSLVRGKGPTIIYISLQSPSILRIFWLFRTVPGTRFGFALKRHV